MKIQFKSAQVSQTQLRKFTAQEIARQKNRKNSFNFEYRSFCNNKKDKIFFVEFRVVINHPADFILQVTYIAQFETSDPIPDNFENSFFININAPAIAFPYLRSFVSTFTLNAGYQPIILPTINFMETPKGKKILALNK